MTSSVLDVLRRLVITCTASLWFLFKRCLIKISLTGQMLFGYSGVNIEKFGITVPFLSVYG